MMNPAEIAARLPSDVAVLMRSIPWEERQRVLRVFRNYYSYNSISNTANLIKVLGGDLDLAREYLLSDGFQKL